MRETKNLKLTQFDPNDVPNWLDQYNTDMEKIDAATGLQSVVNAGYESRFTTDEELINNNRTQINENTQDIANIKDDVKNIKGGSNVSIRDLQTQVTTVEQSVTNLKGGSTRTIAELENDLHIDQQNISALDGRVTNIEGTLGNSAITNVGTNVTSAIGNETLLTNNKTLSGAINEIHNENNILKVVNSGNIIRKNEHELGIKVSLNKPLKDFGVVNNMSIGGTPVLLYDNSSNKSITCFYAYTSPITDNTATSFVLNYSTKESFSESDNFSINGAFITFKFME